MSSFKSFGRSAAGICIEIPPEASRGGQQTYYVSRQQPSSSSSDQINVQPLYNNVNVNVNGGGSPLVELGKKMLDAAEDGDTGRVQELLSKGAPMTADWLGTSPLHMACRNNHLMTVQVLLSAGCSRDARTKVEKTALHVAAREGNVQIVQLLIANHVEVNVRDMLRCTPLHWAVESGDVETVECLLRHGADVNVENKFDKTPLELASDRGNTAIYEALLAVDSYRSQTDEATQAATSSIIMEDVKFHHQHDNLIVPPAATHQEVVMDQKYFESGQHILEDVKVPPRKMLAKVEPKMESKTITLAPASAVKRLGGPFTKVVTIDAMGNRTVKPVGQHPQTAQVIQISPSQLAGLKVGKSPQKVIMVRGNPKQVSNAATAATAGGSHTIKILSMPSSSSNKVSAYVPAAPASAAVLTSKPDDESVSLKRKLAELEEAADKMRQEWLKKNEEAKRIRLKLEGK